MLAKYSLLLLLILINYCFSSNERSHNAQERSFKIDYNGNTFLKDGQPFTYVSGSIHSYRVPKALWKDRLYKIWYAGLNAIETYVFWNEHEQIQGIYNFDDQNNIFDFFEIAQKIGLLVILRPGPYVCGEHEYGGLPWWLLKNDSVIPRTSEKIYMNAVNKWFSVLLPKIKPYLYNNGGPIISVQIENEYGFYYACDVSYRNQLRDIFLKYLGNDVVLFTTNPTSFECGIIENVYSTIDFGIDADVNASFATMRKYSPKGPLVNSEFYPGWLDFWGRPHEKRDTSLVIPPFKQMLQLNASINFYMFHGGTNFGLSAGAHPPYLIQPTNYDYDAPISESGDITQKYIAIRNEIENFYPVPQVPMPKNSTKLALGKIKLDYYAPLAPLVILTCNDDNHIESKNPLSFEKLGQGYGFIMYYTFLQDVNIDGKNLSIPGLRDRAYIEIGFSLIGILDRSNKTSFIIDAKDNQDNSLIIFVENTGRLCFGNDLLDSKGIIGDVYLDGKVLTDWTQCLTDDLLPYFQQTIDKNKHPVLSSLTKPKDPIDPKYFKLPSIYKAELPSFDFNDFDTFLKLDNFKKGIALIYNGTVMTNLGRYWPDAGPQLTLYTPAVFFSTSQNNTILLFDFEGSQCTNDVCYLEFIDHPLIDSL